MAIRVAVQTKAKGSSAFAPPASKRWTVSRPSDSLEREADRAAEQVMGDRGCGCHGGGGQTPRVQLQAAVPATIGDVSAAAVEPAIRATGHELPAVTRQRMEARFGYDFGDVQVHHDAVAAESSRALGARAYTTGAHIVFRDGEYQPSSPSGQRLIAHELAHVIQQRQSGAGATIQRAITLTDPGGTPPHPAGAMGPFPSKAFTLRGWLRTLCPDGNWDVDAATGVVDSPDRATFCAARPTRGHAHRSTTHHRTSCGCLCELTAPGSRTITVQIDENLTVGAASFPLVPLGEAGTSHVTATDKISGFTGRDFVGITGAGATAPLAGAGRTQTIPDPPWIIFGHEVCGHARLQTGPMGPTGVEHSETPRGDAGAVDVENRIRREHSTVASSLGIRRGTFNAQNAAGTMVQHMGSVFRAASGDTISGIAVRCGIPVATMLDHIWRIDGSRITAATQNTLGASEELLIEGIDWHEVISGENMSSIATMWAVPLHSLQRANPRIVAPFTIHPGDRLLVPAS
jgi:hypothetical protein